MDMSGSMLKLSQNSIKEFNNFIDEYRSMDSEILFSLFLFNNEVISPCRYKNIKEVDKLNKKTYNPVGSTSLYDAIGASIDNHIDYLSDFKLDERPDKTLFVILTDGYENSSKEYSRDDIKEMIDESINIFNSEFIYLGANQDACLVANNIGININNSYTYDYSNDGISVAYAKIKNATSSYMSDKGDIVL